MARPKKEYDAEFARSVEAMAAYGVSQKIITELLPDVGKRDLDPDGLYRKDWESGKHKGTCKVFNAYFKMASNGKCWNATKHYLATQHHIVEPKIFMQPQNNETTNESKDNIQN